MRQAEKLPPHQYYYKDDDGNLQVGTYEADALREQKLNAVYEWQSAMEVAPIEYAGHLFDVNQESRTRVMALALAGVGSPIGTWTTSDNIDVPADANFMHGLFVSMVTRTGEVHQAQRRMKNELLALTDAADIAAYEVPKCL